MVLSGKVPPAPPVQNVAAELTVLGGRWEGIAEGSPCPNTDAGEWMAREKQLWKRETGTERLRQVHTYL